MPALNSPPRWYQIPMVWMVIGIPLSSIVVTLLFVWISVQTFDGVVADDYYRKGLEINRDLARDRYAVEAGLGAIASIENGQLRVQLTSDDHNLWTDHLPLEFVHPTVSNRDVAVSLQHQGVGAYSAPLAELGYGKWNVVTGTDEWRLKGVLCHPAEAGFVLKQGQSGHVCG